MSVYFVRHGSLIKIGFSSSLARRIRDIISAIPAEVTFLGHMPGDREMERHLHEVFEKFRFTGEWFSENPSLLALIETIAIKDMPATAVEPSRVRRLDADDLWHQQSERVRQWSALRWPELSHRERLTELQAVLPFSKRRVRALYHYEPGQTLRSFELEAIDEALADAEKMSPTRLDD